jgi:hypothetical protein
MFCLLRFPGSNSRNKAFLLRPNYFCTCFSLNLANFLLPKTPQNVCLNPHHFYSTSFLTPWTFWLTFPANILETKAREVVYFRLQIGPLEKFFQIFKGLPRSIWDSSKEQLFTCFPNPPVLFSPKTGVEAHPKSIQFRSIVFVGQLFSVEYSMARVLHANPNRTFYMQKD